MSCVSELLEKEAMPTATRKLDLPDGVPPLTSLYMYISGSCNLACRHCWISPTYDPDNSKGEFLKLDYIKKAVREAKPLGLQTVKLTGGEPMLHPQFCEIIDYLDTENISITMETNGTLIDDIMAKYLKTKVNFSFVSVSLDGHNSEIHEKIRSVTGCFQKTMNGISALVKAGIKPQVICSIYQGNSREIENFVQLAETLGCGSVKFNLIQKMGRGDDFSQSEGLEINQILHLYKQILNFNKEQYSIQVFFDIPHAFRPIRKLLGNMSRCSILNVLGILSGGEIALCGIGQTVPEMVYGKIGDDDLKKIWTTNEIIQQIRQKIPWELEGICSECIHQVACKGACVANNYHNSKKINAAFDFCQKADSLGYFPSSRKKCIIEKRGEYEKS